ncbi:hypothetical protein SAMN05216241_102374 [Limimonas halophila]|uniref:Uncharacterized protein n=1 Tax=Limimonas halophila TaxID=1082479 RepID=A0A1G7P161_9PROT|nr:hypothetical protein [Limimonas halophila]SDF79359.1 hypothetical protein SAMN05216241_102374 [Limimonas halophila]
MSQTTMHAPDRANVQASAKSDGHRRGCCRASLFVAAREVCTTNRTMCLAVGAMTGLAALVVALAVGVDVIGAV